MGGTQIAIAPVAVPASEGQKELGDGVLRGSLCTVSSPSLSVSSLGSDAARVLGGTHLFRSHR